MRILKWTLKGLLILLIVVVATLGILLGTADGISWLVRTADDYIPGDLRVQQVTGGLFGDLRIDGFHYSDPAMRIELGSLVLRWTPRELLQRRFHVLQLSLIEGHYQQLQASPEEPDEDTGPLELPEIELPLAIVLDRVSVSGFTLITAADPNAEPTPEPTPAPDADSDPESNPGPAPLVLETLLLRLEAQGSTIELGTLEAKLRDLAGLKIQGQVETSGNWPLSLHDHLGLAIPDQPQLQLDGEVSGDLQQLVVKQRISGGIDAQLDAEASDLLGELSWRTQLNIATLSDDIATLVLEQAGVALPADLGLELNADGDLQRAKLDAKLHLNRVARGTPGAPGAKVKAKSAAKATVEAAENVVAETAKKTDSGDTTETKVKVVAKVVAKEAAKAAAKTPSQAKTGTQPGARKAAAKPSFLTLTGSVEFDPLQFQAQGQWQELQWPLVDTPLVVAETGGLTLDGNLDEYRFTLKTQIGGPDIPPGGWSIKGVGSSEKVHVEALQGDVLGGSIAANAKFAWAPVLEWQAELSGNTIDPGHLAADWPGTLEFALNSTGRIDGDQVDIAAEIEKLGGTLRDMPLAGHGKFQMHNATMLFDAIELSSGSAVVKADGKLDEHWDLNWSIDAADLADLLPDLQGRIQAQGKLGGPAAMPDIQAKLAADTVHFQDLQLQHLDADIDIDLDEQGAHKAAANIDLKAQQLGPVGNLVETLVLQVKGPLQTQTIHLAVAHELAGLTLDAKGGLDLDQQQWQGKLGRLDLDGKQWGQWRLKAPVSLSASPEAVKTSDLCLQEGGTALCAEADWKPDGGKARLTLDRLSFDRLKPILPEEVTELTGGIALVADAVLGPTLTAKLDLSLQPGRVTYLIDEAHQVRLSYQGGGLKANYDKKALAATLKLSMEDSGIDATLNVPRPALDKDPLSAPLRGKIKLDFKQLGLLSAFVPQIEKSESLVRGRLTLGGLLGEPKLGGDLVLDMTDLKIPMAGLDLSDLKLTVTGKGTRLVLKGGVSSGSGSGSGPGTGPGSLTLSGDADIDAAKGFPAKLSLKGDNFQAVSLPEAQVMISPDIQVEHGKNGLKVRGQVTIPTAKIRLREIPSGSRSVSSDLVIVSSDDEEVAAGLPIDAELTIILGDDVHFRGFGLLADLGGRLTITQEPGSLPVGNGDIGIIKGSFRSFGQALEIDRGKVFYSGGSLMNPGLNIQASREVNNLDVGVLVTGSAKRPIIKAYASDPTIKEKDARSLLLTGTTSGNDKSASVYAGTNLTEKLSVGTNIAVDGKEQEYVARYKFNKKYSAKMTSSSIGSGAEILYTIEFK